MLTLQLQDLPVPIDKPTYTWADCGDGEFILIRYYSKNGGTIVCGTDQWATRTFIVCPTYTCYQFDSIAERIEQQIRGKERLQDIRRRWREREL